MIATEIQTRGYELDGTRTIPAAVLIRYMEWGRWEFLNADHTAFHQAINSLVVASQSLVILAPVTERLNLQINAWLSRVGNSSLDISQLIVHKDSGSPIALGRATLVNVDAQRRPKPVSAEARSFLEPAPKHFDDSLFLQIESRSPGTGTRSMERQVMASEIDLLKHVNHSRYIDYVEDARKWAFPDASHNGLPITGVTVEYITEALHNQTLNIDIWPTQTEGGFQSQIRHGSTTVANAIVQI